MAPRPSYGHVLLQDGSPVGVTVEVVVQPFVVRLSLHEGAPIYHVGGDPWIQLDGAEEALAKTPAAGAGFGELSFIPICQTVLIRGRRTILVDPGNMHLGLTGLLRWRLAAMGAPVDAIDLVVATHSHHDHLSAFGTLRGKPLVIRGIEREFLARSSWPAYAEAFTTAAASDIIDVCEAPLVLDDGVTVIPTPGHTPGSVSVLVETANERIAIVGDCAMTQDEYETRRLSHWYTPEQRDGINASLDRIAAWKPTLVLPGHDRAFRPGGRQFDTRSHAW